MGIVVSMIHAAIKFYTPCGIGIVFSTYDPNKVDKGQKKVKEIAPEVTKGISRTIMVGGKPFNKEHKLNEYKHIELVKQKKRGLAQEQNEATCKEVDELTKAGILREVMYQTWAYIDDMVIKSVSEEDMLMDIQETFERLRSINMKLNLKKCSFSVEEGLFLGHLITKQGIKANPSKVKTITDL
ncbi:reverse transcriptase domain-containing protein [Tanacetum coccineum]|uniref:Reverse transcriptase domain-containing protein n=1 Tax=Tanacetum coccineum TaxID=301880 RepID=A0ABQ5GZY6_9ASTR